MDRQQQLHQHESFLLESCQWLYQCNNTGVGCLSRGAPHEAIERFQQVVNQVLYLEAMHPSQPPSPALSAQQDEDPDVSSKSRLVPLAIAPRSSSRQQQKPCKDSTGFCVADDDNGLFFSFFPQAFLVDPDIALPPTSRHICSAVVLYNTALAFHIAALETGQWDNLQRAVQLYESAFRVVHLHDLLEDNHNVDDDDYYALLWRVALCNNAGHAHALLLHNEGMMNWAHRMRFQVTDLQDYFDTWMVERSLDLLEQDEDTVMGQRVALHEQLMSHLSIPIMLSRTHAASREGTAVQTPMLIACPAPSA